MINCAPRWSAWVRWQTGDKFRRSDQRIASTHNLLRSTCSISFAHMLLFNFSLKQRRHRWPPARIPSMWICSLASRRDSKAISILVLLPQPLYARSAGSVTKFKDVGNLSVTASYWTGVPHKVANYVKQTGSPILPSGEIDHPGKSILTSSNKCTKWWASTEWFIYSGGTLQQVAGAGTIPESVFDWSTSFQAKFGKLAGQAVSPGQRMNQNAF